MVEMRSAATGGGAGAAPPPGSASSKDSWDNEVPEPTASASSPTFGKGYKKYDARRKPPRAGTKMEDFNQLYAQNKVSECLLTPLLQH